ncbi:hypothetical protein Tter_1034 [Thermobaculum terrenum ATCC BAA-798]|uniref:Uncharacterized protein n=1 Tax=Thermobaculum terrenum (strain ATCC BAA-798 / CCMEE 7001 / YNP1) TaxID=525904 RepID=D1CG94_THET1|nr:hypothetical protein [Thermobaculum terrenum]ACZ41950.1 hypothetical protein Tter_1034 [Thermobaculum terrenum ATCC BAA-798]
MKRAFLAIGIGLLVLILIIVLIGVIFTPTLAQWRDIVIIALGFFLLLWAILMVGLTIVLIALFALIREKIGPILDKANSSAETVRGTTAFVGERITAPLIKVSAAAAGARAAVQAFMRRGNGK